MRDPRNLPVLVMKLVANLEKCIQAYHRQINLRELMGKRNGGGLLKKEYSDCAGLRIWHRKKPKQWAKFLLLPPPELWIGGFTGFARWR
jgi:hypothetical protein